MKVHCRIQKVPSVPGLLATIVAKSLSYVIAIFKFPGNMLSFQKNSDRKETMYP